MSVYSRSKINQILHEVLSSSNLESDLDKQCIQRNFNDGDLAKYKHRLKAIGFESINGPILDAGCGFGQWSIVLRDLNSKVIGTDVDPLRVKFSSEMSRRLDLSNLSFEQSTMHRLNYQDNYFNAIFSFAAITLTPWKETLKEFHRTLNSKGILYFNAYDLGWMIYNIIEQHHPAEDFDPRDWAIQGIKNTTEYISKGKFSPQSPRDTLYIPKSTIQDYLIEIGFNILSITGDGLTQLSQDNKAEPFWPSKKYGYDAVYEILCMKK